MFDALPSRVSVYEVSPRDGLQNEPRPVSLEGKVRLVQALVDSGLRRIELTSFVSPRWVPQLADAEELAREFRAPEGVTLSALCPNAKGFERAQAAGYRALVLTIGNQVLGQRERDLVNGFTVPPRFTAAGGLDLLAHGRWLLRMSRAPRLTFANFEDSRLTLDAAEKIQVKDLTEIIQEAL